MSLSVSKKATQKEQKVDAIFTGIKELLAQHLESIDKSHTYFKAGIDDEFANYLAEYVDNRLGVISGSFDAQMEAIGKILESGIIKFLNDNCAIIDKVYRTNEAGNFLHYFIVLKKDTLKNRRNFFIFMNEYEKESLSQRFPILFDFISTRRAKSIRKAKEIALRNEKKSSQS